MQLPCQDTALLVKLESNYDWHWWGPILIQNVVPIVAVFLAYWFGHRSAMKQQRRSALLQEIVGIEELERKLRGWAEGITDMHFSEPTFPLLKTEYGNIRSLVASVISDREVAEKLGEAIRSHMDNRRRDTFEALTVQSGLISRILREKHDQLDSLRW